MTVTHTANLVQDLAAVRQRTLDLVSHLSTEDLERQIAPIMSPLVWDLGHIAAYEDLWLVHRHAGMALLRPDLAALYDAFETPRAVRGDLEILGYDDALRLPRRGTGAHARGTGDHGCRPRPARDGPPARAAAHRDDAPGDGHRRPAAARRAGSAAAEHAGGLARTSPPAPTRSAPATASSPTTTSGRATRSTSTPSRIALRPVTNATWLRFVEGGGYVRREWWSDEGWAWKEEYDITHHASVAAGDPDAPACHVSLFEAEALARWCGARLPTEAEWEKAVRPPRRRRARVGVDRLDLRRLSRLRGLSVPRVLRGLLRRPLPRPARRLVGDASARRHRTFRNWDLPERRQIFAGVRLARDLGDPS